MSSQQNETAGMTEPESVAAEGAAAEGAAGEAVGAELAELRTALAELTAQVKRDHDRAVHREGVIDRLHEENQVLRRGELRGIHDPVRAALYRLHDMVRREAQRWSAPDPPDPVHAAPLLDAIADEIAEALGRTGAERFTVVSGDPFDAARHRPAAAQPVEDPALDGTVAEALTDGFESADGDQVLRRADVRVAKLKADTPPHDATPREPVRSEQGDT